MTHPAVDLNTVLAAKADMQHPATKEDLTATKDEFRNELRSEIGAFRSELGSAANFIMGELGNMNARLEELGGDVAQLVAKADGVDDFTAARIRPAKRG